MTRISLLSASLCLIGLAGCQSVSSTMLNRLEDNSFIGNSNGSANATSGARPFKGIPITLKVPSHLDVYIEEVYYLKDDGADKPLANPLAGTRLLNVRTEVIKTKKVFTVDNKRPGSGTLNLQTKFSDEQYFKSIASAMQDTTILDSANLLNTALDGETDPATTSTNVPGIVQPTTPQSGEQQQQQVVVQSGPTAAQAAELFSDYVRDTRVVAFKRFDINEPDFELQVDEFICEQLNRCDRCGQRPSFDVSNHSGT